MATRVIQFGVVSPAILQALSGNGYKVDVCGTSIPKLRQALHKHTDADAITVAEHDASKAAGILTSVRSSGKIPVILFQDESRTCDPAQFDVVVPEHSPLSDLLKKVAAVIERSRAIRAKTNKLGERFHSLLRETASLHEQSVTARVGSQCLLIQSQGSATE